MDNMETEMSGDKLEEYFKKTIRALLREAVRRGIFREDQRIEDILKENLLEDLKRARKQGSKNP
ncbi:MAG: hypothetical protein QXQ91_04465 [Nanopusillaceae archaeon]